MLKLMIQISIIFFIYANFLLIKWACPDRLKYSLTNKKYIHIDDIIQTIKHVLESITQSLANQNEVDTLYLHLIIHKSHDFVYGRISYTQIF